MKPGEVKFMFGASYIWGVNLYEGTPVERAVTAAKNANPHNIAVLTEVHVRMEDGVVILEGADFDLVVAAIEERKAEMAERLKKVHSALLDL